MTQDKKTQVTPVWLRKRANLTQRNASYLIGVTEKTLSEWERGVSYPSLSYAPKIMEVYGCTAQELVDAFVISRQKEEVVHNN